MLCQIDPTQPESKCAGHFLRRPLFETVKIEYLELFWIDLAFHSFHTNINKGNHPNLSMCCQRTTDHDLPTDPGFLKEPGFSLVSI